MTVFVLDEQESFRYTVTLQDEAGVAVPLAVIATMTLTYYEVNSGTIINGRDAQNVLNANDVTVHATSGLLTWQGQVADAAILGAVVVGGYEDHCALFTWTWDTPAKTGRHEVTLRIRNLAKVS